MTYKSTIASILLCAIATPSQVVAQEPVELRGDSTLEIRFGNIEGVPGPKALEFVGSDGAAHGWILLNARKEPIIWATTQYQYVFGPLRRFGNLLVPDWATTSNGLVRYEMVSLRGSDNRPDLNLFAPPPDHASE